MQEEQLDSIINTFVRNFNTMCKVHRRDFLIRERTVTYESGESIKKYNVTYIVKKTSHKWKILAVSNGIWIFKKKFPLFEISRAKGKMSINGLFTQSIPDFETSMLAENLEKYLEHCKKLPQDAFVRS
ncbi:MAG: hypothetical protein R2828_03140 [Saprospiraceae bacterium]